MPACRSPWARRRRSTCAEWHLHLGPRPDPVLRLEMDEDVGAAQPGADRVLELGRDAVRGLQRRPGPELDVEVDVAPRARPPGAQVVIAGHAARAEIADGLVDGTLVVVRQRLVAEHARGAGEEP